MIRFEREKLSDLNAALAREWLETNGLGGFSSSTIVGLNTRRYHGLLTAATKPPVGRVLVLSKLEETLVIDGRRFDLSANQYPGAIHPQGYNFLTGFRQDPFPVFTYRVENAVIEKSVFMLHGENTTVIQYDFQISNAPLRENNSDAFIPRPSSLIFELRPLIAFRDYHSTTHENAALNSHVEMEDGLASVKPYADLPSLHFAHDADEVKTDGYWYRNFEYERERERGLDFQEDLFNPLILKFDLSSRTRLSLIASTERRDVKRADEYRQAELKRRETIVSSSISSAKENSRTGDNELIRRLVAAADQYIVARGEQKTVIAGYHWFSDWGRDTMIALPGLTLSTGRFDIARSILAEFALHVERGMLPNRFPDAGETPEYNTVDATLWFFEAVRAYLEYTNDREFVRDDLYNVLVEIIAWHVRGTRYRIQMDADGLLFSGEEGVQLTWMDAKVGDWVVTPRTGKAVEIQALWHNALCIMEEFAAEFEDEAGRERYASMAESARRSFSEKFWNEEADCLYDVVDGERKDASIRPNQIFAVSLPHPLISGERAESILRVVRRELLTPVGLRSLAPSDSQYRGRYEGDQLSRDGAYHQGTVWPWLMGGFITAYLKTFDKDETARREMKDWLTRFQEHLSEAGLGHVSEIFDAEEPHTPRGCIAQAWSVAELLRAAIEVQKKDSEAASEQTFVEFKQPALAS
ncbi:MAG: amylo-alpha-1,6-glucosidase [Pyrinomonadaceae bacterium]